MENSGIINILKSKKTDKRALAKDLGFLAHKPLLAIILEKEMSEKDEEIIDSVLEGLGALDIEVVVLADTNLGALASNTEVLPYSRNNRKKLMSAADMALVFDFNDVEEMLMNGVIPISPQRVEVSDYDPNHETGNGFMYRNSSTWGIFAAVVRAVETFKFPYDWQHIVRHGVESMNKSS